MAELVRFSQQDPRWKAKPLGFDGSCKIGTHGCLLACMAMTASVYGFHETPDTLNEKMKTVKAFQGALVVPSLLGKALPGMVYQDYRDCQDQPAPLTEIDACLAQGKPVIVKVDFSPRESLQDHWIVVYARKDGDYLIQDPWPFPAETGEVGLLWRYGFAGKAAQIIQAVLWLDGPAGAIAPPRPPDLDTGVAASFKVYATVGDLAVRTRPLVAEATLIGRVALNSEFTVLEEDETARPKVGQVNQWLPVKAAGGPIGYTAAWYLAFEKQAPPPAPPALPRSRPARSLVVRTTAPGVALRSKPETTDSTLIKRLPPGSELKALEAEAKARKKIGVLYEWLQVRDVGDQDGWVAAWYVAPAAAAALGAREYIPPDLIRSGVITGQAPSVLLRAIQDGLALRNQPVIREETLLKRLPLGAELVASEPPEIVIANIGRMGEWLHVRDAAGEEGYVAAWYVVEAAEAAEPAVGPSDS